MRRCTRRQAPYPVDLRNMVERVKNNMHNTNNNIEGWHRKLNSAFQSSHPTLWSFLDKLMKEENNIHSDILYAMTGRQPPIERYESFNNRLRQLVDNPHPDIYDHPGDLIRRPDRLGSDRNRIGFCANFRQTDEFL